MQAFTAMSDSTGRGKPRPHHIARTQENQRAVSVVSTKTNGRPYLLTKFRCRKTKESAAVSAKDWISLRKTFMKFVSSCNNFREDDINELKKCSNAEFLELACEKLNYFEPTQCSIVLDDGVKKISITEDVCFYEDDYQTVIRTDHIDQLNNGELKNLIYKVLSFIYKNAPLSEANNNVMNSIASEFLANEKDMTQQCLDNGCYSDEEFKNIKKDIKKYVRQITKYKSHIDRNIPDDVVMHSLKTFRPSSEEKKILQLLKEVVKLIADNKEYFNDLENDYENAYASVIYCLDDFIMLSNCNVPDAYLTWIAETAYDSDVWYPSQKKVIILNDDGNNKELALLSEMSQLLRSINDSIETLITPKKCKRS